jgi:hypothetical protein
MAKLIKNSSGYIFWCPGCEEYHEFDNRWQFNGNIDSPTFSPSLLYPEKKIRCHLFLKDGIIEFLSDCDHKLAGKNIKLEDDPNGII